MPPRINDSQSLSTSDSSSNLKLSHWARIRQLADLLDASWCKMPSDIDSAGQQLVECLEREVGHVIKIKDQVRTIADLRQTVAKQQIIIDYNTAADGKAGA